jgi:hypothetical protein
VFYLGDLTEHQECYYQIRSHHFLYYPFYDSDQKKADHVIDIPIDHALLQDGHVYKSCGYMRRQVVDIKIQRVITEYRAEILEDQNGNQTVGYICSLKL